ncbi:hypothetical protein PAMC26577_00735 [Caballeronia sordidicola]|jgi:hypothetical protein|uniref:Uncharacterized protein n=1 Tax=Caballeronia sordidicola TaxID=196367 RepID=A0A242N6W3_CABSO|nr:hypothetical protein PAMC26577_00735 [Caballeronia sordidicola]
MRVMDVFSGNRHANCFILFLISHRPGYLLRAFSHTPVPAGKSAVLDAGQMTT